MDGAGDDRLIEVGRLLGAAGEVVHTRNLAGARWSKLALNGGGSAMSTITGETVGVAARRHRVRRLALELLTETLLVARAAGVNIESVGSGLDPQTLALTDARGQRRNAAAVQLRVLLSLVVSRRYRAVRSCMLRALENGQDPGIELLNGEVVRRGALLSVPTPVNAAVVRAIQDAAQGLATLGEALLDRVWQESIGS